MGGNRFIDMTGKRFGRLTVIERAESKPTPRGGKRTMWLCQCDCGNIVIIDGSSLRRGDTSSCGCGKRKEKRRLGDVPMPITIQDSLIIGKTYKYKGKHLKLIGLYNGWARFETENGFHECYHYFDLEGKI